MGPIFAENISQLCRNCLNIPFHAVLLLAVWLTGCNNTCFTFTSSPPTGTIGIKVSDPSPSCTFAKANGAVRVVVRAGPVCNSCSESGLIQHIFVSIRGIDVNSSSIADDDSLDWHELAPQLTKQPLQVDLVRDTADRSVREPLGEIVAIPAGIYRQVRVRFVREPRVADQPTRTNVCGGAGLNCIVMADGTVQPLLFDSASPELRIPSERIVGGALHVFPDIVSDLVIEMRPVWSWVSLNRDIRLVPVLTGNARVEHVDSDELGTPVSEVAHGLTSR